MSEVVYEHVCKLCGHIWRSESAFDECDRCSPNGLHYSADNAMAEGAESFDKLRAAHDPVRIVTFPRGLIDAGQRLMKEEYARQKARRVAQEAALRWRRRYGEPCHHGVPVTLCDKCSTVSATLYRAERDYERARFRRLAACYAALWIVSMLLVVLYAVDWRL